MLVGLVYDSILSGSGDHCVEGAAWTRVLRGFFLKLCFSMSYGYLRKSSSVSAYEILSLENPLHNMRKILFFSFQQEFSHSMMWGKPQWMGQYLHPSIYNDSYKQSLVTSSGSSGWWGQVEAGGPRHVVVPSWLPRSRTDVCRELGALSSSEPLLKQDSVGDKIFGSLLRIFC